MNISAKFRAPARVGLSSGGALSAIALSLATLAASQEACAQTAQPVQDTSAVGGDQTSSARRTEIEEIIVTGTLLRGAAPVGSNLITVGPEKIVSSGATTSNELLATIPQVSNLFNTVPSSRLSVAANQVQVVRPNLRNLSPETSSSASTLVLFDGHRIAGVGVTQQAIDPDLIPAGAIERVEVVTDGGSATYGADAVGGVINFVTRKRFDGLKVDARYGFANDYYQVDGSLIAGKDWGSGSLFVSYTYQHNDSIFGRDRDFIKQINWNNQVPIGLSCDPGNVQVRTGAANANFALPGLVANSLSSCDPSDDNSFIPRSTRHGAIAGLHQELSDWLTVDLRAFYGERTSTSFSPYRGSVTVQGPNNGRAAQAFYQPVVGSPAANQTIFFTFAPVLGQNSAQSSSAFQEWGVNAEFKARLNHNWELRTLLSYSSSNSEFHIDGFNNTLLSAAGASSNSQTAVNFYNPAATPNIDLIRQIANSENAGQGRDSLLNLRTILDGTLLDLPGGDVKLAVGYEYIDDQFQQRVAPPNAVRGAIRSVGYLPYDRRAHSAFGELQVPIVGEGNRMSGIHSLVVNGSVRYDHFSDFGSTTNPKIGINYKPVQWVGLRGTYSTSFNAPSPVDQLGASRNTITFFPINAFVRPGEIPLVVGTVALQGSRPDLTPQTAKTYSFGMDLDPPFLSGFHASVNYYHVTFKNLLTQPNSTPVIFTNYPDNVQTNPAGVSAEQLQAFALLAPNGPSVINPLIAANRGVYEIVDFRVGNFGSLKVEGLDFVANYQKATGFGGVDAGLSGNYQLNRTGQTGPGQAPTNLLAPGNINSRLQLQATVGANIGNFRAQAVLNHSSGYKVVRASNLPQDRIGDFNTVNLFFKYDVPSGSLLFKDLSLTLNVNNVFDQDPPINKLNDGRVAGYGNGFTLGRLIQMGISKKF